MTKKQPPAHRLHALRCGVTDDPERLTLTAQIMGLALFAPLPPSVPVDTSEAAAEALTPSRAATLRDQVLHALADRPDTADGLEVRLVLPGNTIRPRLWELERMGLIRKTDLTTPTRAGRSAHVYTLVRCPVLPKPERDPTGEARPGMSHPTRNRD